MNQICEKQNEKENIDLLAAQRYLYSNSKHIFYLRIAIASIFLLTGLIQISEPGPKSFLALASIAYLFLDMFVLEKFEKSGKLKAAKIQELFDANVLDLPWNSIMIPHKPDYETVCEASKGYRNKVSDVGNLFDWYSTSVCNLDGQMARALCQRSNIAWDTNQRRVFAGALIVVITVMFIASLGLAMIWELTVNQFILQVLLPLLPAFNILLRQILSHLETGKRLEHLKNCADNLIEIAKNNREESTDVQARLLQNEIFDHRRTCPLIPNWVYFLLRGRMERQMYYNIEAKIRELKDQNDL